MATYGQFIQFAQFNNAPLYINPALTGNFDGKGRINLNYRYHGSESFRNVAQTFTTMGFDSNINIGKKQIGYGISANVFRVAGPFNYRNNTLKLHSSYIFNIGETDKAHHSIALGGSLGYGIISNYGNIHGYLDLSAGASWKYKIKPRYNFEIGSSVLHFNKPNLSRFFTIPLYPQFIIHGSSELPISKRISVLPSLLFYNQDNYSLSILGSEVKILLDLDDNSDFPFLKFGMFSRGELKNFLDYEFFSFIGNSTYEAKRFKLALAYEHARPSESKLLEFTVGYKINESFF